MTKEDCLNQARQHKKTGDEKASKRYYDGDDYYVASLYFLAAEKFEEVINCMEKWLVIQKRIVRQVANDKQYKNLKMGWILTEVQQYEELLEFLKNERLVRKLGQLLFSKPSPITNDMLTAISYTRFDESGRRIVRITPEVPIRAVFPPKVAPLFYMYIAPKSKTIKQVRMNLSYL